jgi:protein-S-isoprenylcysteine O-methyltransferase Ste14
MDRSSTVSTDNAGVMVPPPLIYVAFFLGGVGMQRYVPLPPLPAWTARILAGVLVLSWLLITIWSFRRFWVSGTSIVPVRPSTALVIEGPYRLTRNPMYLGLLSLYLGVTCWSGLMWPLILTPVLVWVIHVTVIGREERYLIRKFGDDYRRYQAQVRRWL